MKKSTKISLLFFLIFIMGILGVIALVNKSLNKNSSSDMEISTIYFITTYTQSLDYFAQE